jgi:Cu/Zn superoxide dismutase
LKKVTFVVMVALALFALSSTLVFAHDAVVTMNEQNGSGQNGTAMLVGMDDGTTMVTLDISNGTNEPQPAHIHAGTCADLDPKPAYPLNNVVDGKSETIVPVDVHDLTEGTFAINVHKSAKEATVYTSCGDLTLAEEAEESHSPGMPTTGNAEQNLILGALALLAVTLVGAGLQLARRKA